MLRINGAAFEFATKGMVWSTLAGVVGALGALGVLLAFGAKGSPAVVMSIVFAGAPIINAIVAMSVHQPGGGWGSIRWQFIAGIVLAGIGACMVTLYKPPPGKSVMKPPVVAPQDADSAKTSNRTG